MFNRFSLPIFIFINCPFNQFKNLLKNKYATLNFLKLFENQSLKRNLILLLRILNEFPNEGLFY